MNACLLHVLLIHLHTCYCLSAVCADLPTCSASTAGGCHLSFSLEAVNVLLDKLT